MDPSTTKSSTSGLFTSITNSNPSSGLFAIFSNAHNVPNPATNSGNLFQSVLNTKQSDNKNSGLFSESKLSSNTFTFESPISQSSDESNHQDLSPVLEVESLPEVTSTTVADNNDNDNSQSISPKTKIKKSSISPGSFNQKSYIQRRLSKDKETPTKPLAIKVLNIPDTWNKETLIAHFQQFGDITKPLFYQNERKLIVYFNDWNAASHAKNHGSKTKDGLDVGNVFYYVSAKRTVPTPKNEEGRARKALFSANLKTEDSSVIANKLTLLEARDKAIRMNTIKKGSRSSALVGTCPDMCSEKERYFREKALEISVYECDPSNNNPDHRRFVTNYSRSSADQEEPLPSDLRPPPILKRTMLYLLSGIADLGERQEEAAGKLGRWFEFLWSRTRAIRKEITQQQLCDLDVVSILEKITRFHIYCSERLCEEDSHSFDPKINSDNLTKCLQTLREMYHDLQLNYLSSSPNEAEFRAYMILMKLDDDSILNEVHLLSEELRASEAVTFAMETYYCLRTNNYVRFFKMVERADYLSGCMLHRYFYRMRMQALEVMIKAYCQPSKGSSALPLSLLCKQLKFETILEAREFCELFQLSIDALDNLFFERTTKLQMVDGPTPNNRAVSLIESKRGKLSVGEVLNGGPLSPAEEFILPVVNSFDVKGRLRDAPAIEIDLTDRPPSPTQDRMITFVQDAFAIDFLREHVDENIRSVCREVCQQHDLVMAIFRDTFEIVNHEDCVEIAQSTMGNMTAYLEQGDPVVTTLLAESIREFLEDVVQEELEINQQEENQLREGVILECYAELLDTVIEDYCHETVKKENIWDEEMQLSIKEIYEEVLQEESFELTGCSMMDEFKKRQYFKKWTRIHAYRKANQDALYYMAAGPPVMENFVMAENLLGAHNFDAKLGSKKARLKREEKILDKSSYDLDKEIEEQSLIKIWSPLSQCDKDCAVTIILPSQSSNLIGLTALWYHWFVMKLSHCQLSTIESNQIDQQLNKSLPSPVLLLCFMCKNSDGLEMRPFNRPHHCLMINCDQNFCDLFNPNNIQLLELFTEEQPSIYWNLLIESKLNALIANAPRENAEPSVPFEETISLKDFIEEFFHNNFFVPISQDYQCRVQKHLPHHSLRILIEAYNRVVHLLETHIRALLPPVVPLDLDLLLPDWRRTARNRSEVIHALSNWMEEGDISWPCHQKCLNLWNTHRKRNQSRLSKELNSFPWTDVAALCANDRLSNSKIISVHGSQPISIDVLWKLEEKPLADLLPIDVSSVSADISTTNYFNDSTLLNLSLISNENEQSLLQTDKQKESESINQDLLEMNKKIGEIRQSLSQMNASFNSTVSEL